jgi:ubiquinone/menaquinone biosynthesis C-methylase UbiE
MHKSEIKDYYNIYHDCKSSKASINIKSDINDNSRENNLLDILKVKHGDKILDVGCGKGIFLAEAKRWGLACYGIDISEKALSMAKQMTDAYYICADVEQGIFYPDGFFDYVTCLGVWEHFRNQEVVMMEMARVLKNTGKMCVFVPNEDYILHKFGFETDNQPIVNRYSLHEYIKRIQGSGLVIEKLWKDNSHLYNLRESSGYIKHFFKILAHPFVPLLPMELSYHFMFICKKGKKR